MIVRDSLVRFHSGAQIGRVTRVYGTGRVRVEWPDGTTSVNELRELAAVGQISADAAGGAAPIAATTTAGALARSGRQGS